MPGYFSNVNGYIILLELKQGEQTIEGSTVIRLADLSTIWTEVQVSSSQLLQIDSSGIAEVQIHDKSGKKMIGEIEFAFPEINSD